MFTVLLFPPYSTYLGVERGGVEANGESGNVSGNDSSNDSSSDIASTAGSESSSDKIEWLDVDDLYQDIGKRNMSIMLYFYTDWCNFCDDLEDDTFSDKRVIQESRNFRCYKVDGDKKGSIVSRYDVNAYPTVVFLNASGNEYNRIKGYVEAGDFYHSMVTGNSPEISPTCSLTALNWAIYSILGVIILYFIGNYFYEKKRG